MTHVERGRVNLTGNALVLLLMQKLPLANAS